MAATVEGTESAVDRLHKGQWIDCKKLAEGSYKTMPNMEMALIPCQAR